MKISRRVAVKGLAGLALAIGGYSCASPDSSLSPTPTASPHSLSRIIYTYQGHTARVTAVAWSLRGNRIASGSLDKTVQVWDATTGSHVSTYRGHTDGVVAVAWSPDSQFVASGSLDKTAQVWQVATDAHVTTYQGHTARINAVVWSPDGKYIASGSLDTTVQVWEATTGKVLYTYRGYNVGAAQSDPAKGVLPDLIFAVAWAPDDKRIVTAYGAMFVQVSQAL